MSIAERYYLCSYYLTTISTKFTEKSLAASGTMTNLRRKNPTNNQQYNTHDEGNPASYLPGL